MSDPAPKGTLTKRARGKFGVQYGVRYRNGKRTIWCKDYIEAANRLHKVNQPRKETT